MLLTTITKQSRCLENLSQIKKKIFPRPNLICYKLAEKLKENGDVSLCFMVDNSKINPSNRVPCFNVYNFGDDQKLKQISA